MALTHQTSAHHLTNALGVSEADLGVTVAWSKAVSQRALPAGHMGWWAEAELRHKEQAAAAASPARPAGSHAQCVAGGEWTPALPSRLQGAEPESCFPHCPDVSSVVSKIVLAPTTNLIPAQCPGIMCQQLPAGSKVFPCKHGTVRCWAQAAWSPAH